MSTSAAVPGDLERYAAAGRQANDAWAPLLPGFADSLQAARAALARAALPPGIGVMLPPIDQDLRDALLEVAHLDGWVASVAAAFRAADAGSPGSGGGSSVDDDRLAVGWADRRNAEAQARLDARALASLLAGGLPTPDPGGRSVGRQDAARRVEALASLAGAIAAHGHDADYAATLVNALGHHGVRRLLDAINQAGVLADLGVVDGDHAFDGVVVPAARLLGDADRSGRMDPAIGAELLDLGSAVDPSAPAFRSLGLAGQADAEASTDRRRRALALVVANGHFSSTTKAAAAGGILRSAPADPLHSDREGFTGALADRRPELALTEALALGALRDDDAALAAFLTDRSAGPSGTNLTALLQPAATVIRQIDPGRGSGPARDAVADRYQALRVAVLDRGLVQLPALGATATADETVTATAVVDAVRRLAPDGSLDPDVQRALALFVARFAPDIATAVDPDPAADLPPGRLGAVHPDDIAGFLTAISGDAPARQLLLAEGSALLRASLAVGAERIATGRDDFAMGTAVVVNFFGALFDAARRAGAAAVAEHDAAVRSLSVVLGPVFDLVSNTVLNGGGPVLATSRSAAHAQSTTLAHQVAELLVPDAEIADLSKLGTGIESAFLAQARRALFADDAARAALGGPTSLVGLSPAIVEAVYRAFVAPDPTGGNGPTGATASSRLRPIENGFTSLFRSMVAFDEMADRLDHQPGTRTH